MFSFTRQVLQSLQKPLQHVDVAFKGLSTCAATVHQNTTGMLAHGLRNPLSSSSTNSLFKNNSLSNSNVQSVRTRVRVYYRPSAWKRYNKHNIEKRLTTPGGIEVLWRRVLKGRHNLAVYERILPNTVDCKILAKHQTKYKKHPLTKQKLPKPGLF